MSYTASNGGRREENHYQPSRKEKGKGMFV